jgi:energy-converting hydrogenase Eha subunit B
MNIRYEQLKTVGCIMWSVVGYVESTCGELLCGLFRGNIVCIVNCSTVFNY